MRDYGLNRMYPFLFESVTRDFYFRFGLPSARNRRNRSQQTQLFKNALQSGDF